MIQYGVAALVKDMPSQVVFCAIPTGKHENRATTDCALSWIIRVAPDFGRTLKRSFAVSHLRAWASREAVSPRCCASWQGLAEPILQLCCIIW